MTQTRILLKRELIQNLQTPNPKVRDVQIALQKAVKLEHSTIPVYLYALYSLNQDKNAEIASILQTVVIEEMLHMTLAANVLSALGGTPEIDHPDFIPTYPGHLPGGVDKSLKVHLKKFSLEQLDAFLDIETPEDPLNFRAALVTDDNITIGQFYDAISTAIGKLGDGAFVKPPRHQVGPEIMHGSIVVSDVASARKAIHVIVVQGEGTRTSPVEAEGDDYAHYYRYMQIKKGHLLEKQPVPGEPPDRQYAYNGPVVPFDPTGVHAVPDDPSTAPYTPAQRFANDNFNYTYTSLLRALHALFNGQATNAQFNIIFALMMSLKEQAKAMMSGIPNPAVLTGPSFEYQPVNPATAVAV
jgi:hypothetical protein